MKLRAIVVMALVMALGAAPASAGPDGSIDLFPIVGGVPDLGACQGTTLFIPFTFGQIQLSMQVRLAGATAAGISGIEGFLSVSPALPPNWSGSILPATGALATGDWFKISDPNGDGTFDTFRGNVVFSGVSGPLPEDNCQVGVAGLQPVATVSFADFAAPANNILPNTRVTVAPANPTSVPSCSGKLIATLCNAPVFTAVCITGGQFLINPSGESCSVGVAQETWSTIKSLYN